MKNGERRGIFTNIFMNSIYSVCHKMCSTCMNLNQRRHLAAPPPRKKKKKEKEKKEKEKRKKRKKKEGNYE